MNRKVIKSVLSKKFNAWADSIWDEDVKKLIKDNSIITGGAIASMFLNEKVSDYDIYFKNKETALAIAKYYINQFNEHKKSKHEVQYNNDRIKIYIKSKGIAEIEDDNSSKIDLDSKQKNNKKLTAYRPIFLTDNAITLSNKVQLIIRFWGKPGEIHKNYDFVHCSNYWTSWNNQLTTNIQALEALLSRELKYVGSKYPVCSIVRIRKFIKRGFHINAGQMLKIMFQISKLDLSNIDILEEQLTGVDVAYFMELIKALRCEKEKNPEFEVDDSYISGIIDKIFG